MLAKGPIRLQFLAWPTDNCEMGNDGSPFGDDAEGSQEQLSPADGNDQSLERREPYLRRALDAFEAGRLDAYAYTQLVVAINAASSTDEMEAIVEQGSEGATSLGGARGLDAVDLARLRSPASSGSRSPTARYVALAIVFVLFAVLIGIGMWLATHVHGAALPPNVNLGRADALAPSFWS
jgi:hypothetical protein